MSSLWSRYQEYLCASDKLSLSLDISRINFEEGFWEDIEAKIQKAFDEMEKLEAGSIANPDEKRMVGHYWLRAPERAPSKELSSEIEEAKSAILDFTKKIHEGKILSSSEKAFKHLLVAGIGGSALGPQWVSSALSKGSEDAMTVDFLDNTDPEGLGEVMQKLKPNLDQCLVIVISKSGSTPETRNAMLFVQDYFKKSRIDFSKHAVAITGSGSKLHKTALSENWIASFPMWDWVGGRTSELSAVGLLPAALQGIDIDSLLRGAADCDTLTRERITRQNPAAVMALMWYHCAKGAGAKDLVVLPYKDKLLLFSRYLQQLIMESLGKEKDLDGKTVYQGLSVYGNKGSTDQHAYVQQLREGVNNFFVCFIDCLQTSENDLEVEAGIFVGDYLHGFLQGTRSALYENGRESMTITIEKVDAYNIGVLIALFERAVGLYASLVHINAYHQPGVEAGKLAAAAVLDLQVKILDLLQNSPSPLSAAEIAEKIHRPNEIEMVYKILTYLVANHRAKASSAKIKDFEKTFSIIR